MASERTNASNPYRLLPSVDEALRRSDVSGLIGRVPRDLLAAFVQSILDAWRDEIRAGSLDAAGLETRLAGGAFAAAAEARVREEEGRGVRRVINATGVVLHTGLGRAPVHPDVAARMASSAREYCALEVDRFSGRRNRRDERLSELVRRFTGSEAAIAVNNNAAAVFLTLQTFASGKEAVVSRGELVEIGGSFRIPDVMARAGAKLVEVGTTNRTRSADYLRAAGAATGLLMKVHTSNFRVVGFTEDVSPTELAALGRELGVTTAFDLGSGLFEVEGTRPLDVLAGETLVRDAIASGIDVVTFSGDKLLGGPQAGFAAGKRETVEALRENPIYRAVRLDKVALTGLEETLALLAAGRGEELPVRRMLQATAQELQPIAWRIADALARVEGIGAEVVPSQSEPGSGSAPGIYLDTFVVRVTHGRHSAEQLAQRLRAGDPPVFGRIHENALLLDPRTLLSGDEEDLVAAVAAALA